MKNRNFSKMKMNGAAIQLASVIKTLIKDELSHRDDTCVCKIFAVHEDTNTYDVCVEPDETSVLHGLPVIGNVTYKKDEYVYVYKIKNQLSNAFILSKISHIS